MIQYWRFYWPLALTGLAMVLAVQFQNAALARFPQAVTELAVFALAYSAYGLFHASLNFVAQLSNVYARSPQGTARSWRFATVASACIMLPLLVLAHTEAGSEALRRIYGIEEALVARVTEYLAYLAPLLLISAQRFYCNGLLVQARLTGWVTTLTVTYLLSVLAGLIAGFTLGLKPVHVLVGAEGVALLIQLTLSLLIKTRRYAPPEDPEHEDLTYAELLRFFLPVSTTAVMFALSRPILYAFVARTPNGVLAIAAMRVAFDFATIFQQAANQFRHFFVTFGWEDLEIKRRFLSLVCAGITTIMLAVAITPLSELIWGSLMGIPGPVRELSEQVLLVMCLMPALIVFRNYHHGRLMVERRTSGMAAGGILRVAAILLAAQVCTAFAWLNYVSASFILILGFVVEAVVAMVAAQKGQGSRAKATANM
ncbi:MAG: hypothetical protein GWM88_16120 [Pseudomonadales bacterium]|nr:hypothetical protein [Pseudomonadales bacterium]NIX09461.1 hypothetical protein [Pseudomonadales bacterium]